MAQYTRVNIIARRKVLDDAKNLLDDNIKNLTINNKTQEYLEMFFEYNRFDDIAFFETLCSRYPDQEILFISSVELSFETNKYINHNGQLLHIYYSNNYPYYEDDKMNSIIWPDLDDMIKH